MLLSFVLISNVETSKPNYHIYGQHKFWQVVVITIAVITKTELLID
jgi:hypothetical protein